MKESKPRWQEIVEGLQIMGKYGDHYVGAEHDEIFAGPPPARVSKEDRAALRALGWSRAEESDCWQKFV